MFDSGNIALGLTSVNDSNIVIRNRFDQLKSILGKEAGETAFRSFIHPLDIVSFSQGVLEVSVPTRFIRDWVKNHYADRIMKIWAQVMGACNRVDISINDRKSSVPATAALPPVANENRSVKVEGVFDLSSPLDARFTFENYVTGPSNALAYSAALRLAGNQEVSFNPLYLQGGVGLGKTHLMQAAASAMRQKDPSRRVVYMSAEKFMYQFVRAIRAQDTMSFKEQFRNIDVLMIDDLQFICGKEQTQQEFFHTFNALVDQGKQIVLSCDRAPADLDGIDERLRSRLGMGLVATIQPADNALRQAVLRAKSAVMKRDIPDDVVVFLADKINTNVRELEGALNRLIAHSDLAGKEITRDTAEDILQDLIRAGDRRVTVEDIQKKVAEHYSIRMSDILSPRRARPVARPRQVAMYLCKIMTEHSLPEIGRKFAGRDHTTIIHGIRKIEELMRADAAIRQDVETLKRAINA